MHYRALLLFIIISLIIASCFTVPPPVIINVENPMTFSADFESVWSALMVSLSTQGNPVQTIEKSSGIINTDWQIIGSQFDLDTLITKISKSYSILSDPLMGGSFVPMQSARMRMNLVVFKIDDKLTQVLITTKIEILATKYRNPEWISLESNGYYEKQVFDSVNNFLKRKSINSL